MSTLFWNTCVKSSIIGRYLPTLLSSMSIFAGSKSFSFGILARGNKLFQSLSAALLDMDERYLIRLQRLCLGH